MPQISPFPNYVPNYLHYSRSLYVLVVDFNGQCQYANPRLRAKLAARFVDPVGVDFGVLVAHPADAERCRSQVRCCASEPEGRVAFRARLAGPMGGGAHWLGWELSVLANQSGPPTQIIGIGRNLGQKDGLRARAYAKRLSEVLANVTDAYFVMDDQLRIRTVNAVFEQLIGIKKAQAVGMSIWDIMKKEKTYAAEAFEKALQQQQATHFEDYAKRLDKWFFTSVYPSGNRLLVFFQDITKLKAAEARVKQSEQRLSAMMNSKSEVKIFVYPDGRIGFFNKLAANFLPGIFNQPIATGRPILDYFGEAERAFVQAGIAGALAGQHIQEEYELPIFAGNRYWFAFYYCPVSNQDENVLGVGIYLRDINAQKLAESKIKQYVEVLRQVSHNQSHRLRHPVATILGLLNLLAWDKLDAENRELLGYMEESAQKLDEIIHDSVAKLYQAESDLGTSLGQALD
jgi:PAS domain S-box-containing protein